MTKGNEERGVTLVWTYLYNKYLIICDCIIHSFCWNLLNVSIKNEGVTAIFPNFDFIFNRENQRHAFIFARNDLKFFV